jgi:RHS repeat-associated protein
VGGNNNIYFAGKLVMSRGVIVATDRLGTVRANGNGEQFAYYPYGEERTSTADGREKFGTYVRDSPTQDYADQRYYAPGSGRFMTPDIMGLNAAKLQNPGSWNRYAYAYGDPINLADPTGRTPCGDLFAKGQVDYCYDPCDPATWENGFMPAPDPTCNADPDPPDPGPTKKKKHINPPCDPGFLNDTTTYKGPDGYSFTGKDINFAARAIFAESTPNSDEHKAMADVIYNRVDDAGFGSPQTLTAVVTAKRQFNAVTPPGPNFKFRNSGPGSRLNPTDCAALTDSIQQMLSVVQNGASASYTFFGAAGTHAGTTIGGTVFW